MTTACPICDRHMHPTTVSALDRLVTGEGPFTVVECSECRYGTTVPRLDDGALARYYPSEYYEDFYEHTRSTAGNRPQRLREQFRRRSAKRRFRRVPYHLHGVNPGRMLDVGCGGGSLLQHFAEQGWNVYGIDPSESAAAAAAQRGARVHRGTLDDHPWQDDSFQLIVFQHSLEHIVNPVDALRRACALLAAKGLLIIEVPNWNCWQRRLLFRNRWFHLDLPRHQQHFSPLALERLAKSLKLQVRCVGTASTAISAAYSLHYLLAGRWTPGWRLWLSYALGIVALPLVLLGDRIGGGDCCYIVMEAT